MVIILQNYRRIDRYAQGVHAEVCALKHLEKMGMICIAKRLKTPYGEIDLLMQDKQTLVAVEVKYRQSLNQAAYSIKPKQQLRIQQAFAYWISQHTTYRDSPPFQRFDVVLVCPGYKIIHYQNAWTSEISN